MRKGFRQTALAVAAVLGVGSMQVPTGTDAAGYSLADAQNVLKIALNIDPDNGSVNYDFDGDGRVSLLDAQLCLKYALHIVTVPKETTQPSIEPEVSELPASSMKPVDSGNPASWMPAESTAPSYSALPEVSETPSPVPSLLPEESDEPSETPVPASAVPTVRPATPTPVPTQTSQPNASTAPVLNTKSITLYTGTDVTTGGCATVSFTCASAEDAADIYFGSAQDYYLDDAQDEKTCFYYYYTGYDGEGRFRHDNLQEYIAVTAEAVQGNTATFSIGLKDYVLPTVDTSGHHSSITYSKKRASGEGFLVFRDAYQNIYTVEVAVQNNSTVTIRDVDFDSYENFWQNDYEGSIPVMSPLHEWYCAGSKICRESDDITFSDPSVITRNEDGTIAASGPCVITEFWTEKDLPEFEGLHMNLTCVTNVTEAHLVTRGVYDPEKTKAVREALLDSKTAIYNTRYSEAYRNWLYEMADKWYRGEISYRYMYMTFKYYKFDDTAISSTTLRDDGTLETECYHLDSWSNGGYGQNVWIYHMEGIIDTEKVQKQIETQLYGKGAAEDESSFMVGGIFYVRVHYEAETDTSWLYFIL